MKFLQNKKVLILIFLVATAGIGGGVYYYLNQQQKPKPPEQKTEMPKFKSCGLLESALKKGEENYFEGGGGEGDMPMMAAPAQEKSSTPEHSKTNVQVEGVDEGDIVKNDGQYIYTVSGNNTVEIINAYPPENAKVSAKLNFGNEKSTRVTDLFIDDSRLIVMGTDYENTQKRGIITFIKIYETSNKEKPQEVRSVEYEGTYSTSRKVNDNIYLVLSTSPNYYLYGEKEKKEIKASEVIPEYKDSKENKDFSPACDCGDVGYVLPDKFTSFLSIVSLSVKDDKKSVDKQIIGGFSDNVYASDKNIYVTSANSGYYGRSFVPDENFNEKTSIYKFKMNGPATLFQGSTEVPGTTLNQFSMDEYQDHFRIATTKGQVWNEEQKSQNNIYVLGSDLKIVGELEGLAQGEEIYSVRFTGSKAYLVTFKKIDPFFTLDMSDPKNPKVLGALKIPGYSDYLHPYDENHIIGIGKNTEEATEELKNERNLDFAWYQGIKIALFDVTDFKNPKEMYKVLIGDRGTESPALDDHKAFLFDKDKKLLVIPVSLAELTDAQKKSANTEASTYGNFTFQGAYVYNISLEGINLKGRITHLTDSSTLKSGYYGDGTDAIKRSLYIGDYLYTISQKIIKANKLSDLSQVADINLK